MDAVIIDVDGVLLKWKENLPFFMHEVGLRYKLKKIHSTPDDVSAVDMFNDVSDYELRNIISSYSQHECSKYFPCYPDAYLF